jgi:hypothetical protein
VIEISSKHIFDWIQSSTEIQDFFKTVKSFGQDEDQTPYFIDQNGYVLNGIQNLILKFKFVVTNPLARVFTTRALWVYTTKFHCTLWLMAVAYQYNNQIRRQGYNLDWNWNWTCKTRMYKTSYADTRSVLELIGSEVSTCWAVSLKLGLEYKSRTPRSLKAFMEALLEMLTGITLIIKLALQVLFLRLGITNRVEFPNRKRPPCTTMPWCIWPALAVLWGVCWMFYPAYSGNEGGSVPGMFTTREGFYDFGNNRKWLDCSCHD